MDWTSFDVSSALRVLRAGNEASIRRTLRRLHLRWWHASTANMNRLLSAAGCPNTTLQLIPEIVDTCRACRLWHQPLSRPVGSSNMALNFNEQVQCDLLFYLTHIVFHALDSCTRWHISMEVEGKTEDILLTALVTGWFAIFGPPKTLVCDGEAALAGERASQLLSHWGVSRIPRAPNQHAQLIERRGALLRDQLHRIDAQLNEESLTVPFKMRLAEATFAGNALISVNKATPYQAVLGRTPALLPQLSLTDAAQDDGNAQVDLVRYAHRVREVALQSLIEGTAKSRILRALQTRTQRPGEALELVVGQEIEFYRPPGSKDASGWKGPATVTDLSQMQHGTIGIRWQGNNMIVRTQDLRSALVFLCYQASVVPLASSIVDPLHFVQLFVTQLHKQVLVLGWVNNPSSGWHITKATGEHLKVYLALLHIAACGIHLEGCITARVGSGVGHISGLAGTEQSLVIWWSPATD
jgi:hypothetical protein